VAEVWTPPAFDDVSTGELVTASQINALGNSLRFLKRIAYVEFTSDVSITATSVGTANQIVSAGAFTYEASPIIIEIFIVRYSAPAQGTRWILRDGTTVLGTLTTLAASESAGPLYFSRSLTPTAASHTYNVAAWLAGAGTGTVNAGSGGAAGDTTTYLPGYIAVYRVPT
jgi:hypothetical protein